MSVFLQVVSVRTVDTTPCICLWTENQRYLVNAGEGTQRICVEHKLKIKKIEHILLTDLSIQSIGGLPGLWLTSADSGRTQLSITGPEGLQDFLSSTDSFARRSALTINAYEATNVTWHDHGDIKIGCIPISCASPLKRSHEGSNHPTNTSYTSVCYLFETPQVLGTFNVAKARAMGIPPGPIYGKLKAGNDVTLEDGRVICAADLTTGGGAGRVCICVPDLPLEYLHEFTVFDIWQNYQGENGSVVDCICHFSSAETVLSSSYMDWMHSFHPEVVHLMCGAGICEPVTPFRAAAIQTCKLHALAPQLFPAIQLRQPVIPSTIEAIQQHQHQHRLQVVSAAPLVRMLLLPLKRKGIDSTYVINENIAEDLELKPNVVDEIQSLNLTPPPQLNSSPCGLQITFLGTGCAIPAKNRNVSAIAIQALHNNLFLLDAGEGTWAQLCKNTQAAALESDREYRQIALKLAKQIRVIWISHPHADHHLGLLRILIERKRAFAHLERDQFKRARTEATESASSELQQQQEEQSDNIDQAHQNSRLVALQNLINTESMDEFQPCIVIAPPTVLRFLRAYQKVEPSINDLFIGFSNYDFDPEATEKRISTDELPLFQELLQTNFSIRDLVNVRVEHCSQAFALVVSSDQWKLVYSGDCRPSETLIQAGTDATVLIHEATFEEEQQEEAVAKKHSTCNEAIDVGKRMNAQATILTHFSQRNPALPTIAPDKRVCVAYDFMNITLQDLEWAPAFMPAFRLATTKDETEDAEAEIITDEITESKT